VHSRGTQLVSNTGWKKKRMENGQGKGHRTQAPMTMTSQRGHDPLRRVRWADHRDRRLPGYVSILREHKRFRFYRFKIQFRKSELGRGRRDRWRLVFRFSEDSPCIRGVESCSHLATLQPHGICEPAEAVFPDGYIILSPIEVRYTQENRTKRS
jgi:hypothetical protein